MTQFRHLLAVAATVGLLLAACGGDDHCNSDHDCENTEQYQWVCEPDGCRQLCDDDTDCPATDQCVDRRVEEGNICETTDHPLSNNS